MPTFDQIAGIRHLMLLIDFLAKKCLYTFPESSLDDRLVGSGEPLATKLDLANVGTVSENRVQLAATDLGH